MQFKNQKLTVDYNTDIIGLFEGDTLQTKTEDIEGLVLNVNGNYALVRFDNSELQQKLITLVRHPDYKVFKEI